jgi:hypothetical protein
MAMAACSVVMSLLDDLLAVLLFWHAPGAGSGGIYTHMTLYTHDRQHVYMHS